MMVVVVVSGGGGDYDGNDAHCILQVCGGSIRLLE